MSQLFQTAWEHFFLGCATVGLLAGASRPLEALRHRAGLAGRLAARLVTALRWAAGIAASSLGSALAAGALMISSESAASVRWPLVAGRVLTVDSQSVGHSDFAVTIRYAYRVGGTEHINDRVWLDQLGEDFRTTAPETWIRRFQPGTSIAVHYDARHPERSVLVPGALVGSTAIRVALGTSMVAGALAVPLLGRRRDRRRPDPRCAPTHEKSA